MSNDRDRPYRGLFGVPPPAKSFDNFLADISSALETSNTLPKPVGRGLAGMFLSSIPTSQPNSLVSSGLKQPPLNTPALIVPNVRRKVFFSFYFDADIRRSVIVRNSYRYRPGPKLPTASFYDKSLWESSKREGVESLKRLIREGMTGSSVTCVLAGTHTWQRPWVRYEIARSLMCGNGLFTVHIHNVKDPQHGIAPFGPNPLSFVGLELRPDGRGNICELVDGKWRLFDKHKMPVRWPPWLMKPDVGYIFPLSHNARTYDYGIDDGYHRLGEWAQLAAQEARRPR